MKPKIYLRDWNGVLQGVMKSKEFEWVDDPRDADCLVLWQDIRGELRELCRVNKEYLHKPVVIVQHGASCSRDYQPPESFKLMADKFCCWAQHDYERMEKLGYKDRTVITGSPLINRLKPLVPHTDRNIILCPIISMHEEPANIMTYYELKKIEMSFAQEMLKKHKEKLRDSWNPLIMNPDTPATDCIPYYDINKNWRLISKLTGIHDKPLYMGAVTITQPADVTHIENCVRLLTQTDIVVGMVEGSFQLLAMAMDVPVVICTEWGTFKTYGGLDYSKSELIKTDASAYTDLHGLRDTIEKELADPGRLREERKKTVLREFGDITQDPDKNIIKVIKEIIKNG